jgi:hypothetical protein
VRYQNMTRTYKTCVAHIGERRWIWPGRSSPGVRIWNGFVARSGGSAIASCTFGETSSFSGAGSKCRRKRLKSAADWQSTVRRTAPQESRGIAVSFTAYALNAP